MATTAGTTWIDLRARLDQFERDLKTAEGVATTGAKKIGGRFQTISSKAGTVADKTKFLSLGLAAGLFKASQEASHLNEVMSFSTDVFGTAEKDMVSWSETALDSMGIAQVTALEAANTYGIFLTKMGHTKEEAAGLSQQMVQLAVDMSSAKDVPLEESLQAIASGLAGESEPLRRFGIDVRDAALQQQALSDGLIKGKQELTGSAKEQAKLNAIMAQSTVYAGNYAKTADEQANQQRRAAEAMKEAGAALGKVLTPVMADFMGTLADVLKSFTALPEPIQKAVVAFAALGVALSPVAKGVQLVSSGLGVLAARQAAATAATTTATVATTGATAATGGLAASLGAAAVAAAPFVAIAGAAAGAVFLWKKAYDAWRGAQEAHAESVDASVNHLDAYMDLVKSGKKNLDDFRLRVSQLASEEGLAAEETERLRMAAAHLEAQFSRTHREINGVVYSVRELTRDLKNVPDDVQSTVTVTTIREQVRTTGSGKLPAGVGVEPRAIGGPALPRRQYLVGERGPELLTMGSERGHVTSNNALSRPYVFELHMGGKVIHRSGKMAGNRHKILVNG